VIIKITVLLLIKQLNFQYQVRQKLKGATYDTRSETIFFKKMQVLLHTDYYTNQDRCGHQIQENYSLSSSLNIVLP